MLLVCELQLLRSGSCGVNAEIRYLLCGRCVVERNGGIYWLYYGNLGREDSNLFSVSLFPFTSRISISFVAKKKLSANTRLKSLLAAPLVGISYAPSRLGTSPCALFLLRMHDA